jgi:hypothetical protein
MNRSGFWPAGNKNDMKRFARSTPLILLVLTASLVLPSCASLKRGKRMDQFQTTTSLYRNAIRWNNFKAAAGFLEDPGQALEGNSLDRLRLVKVTEYDVVGEKASPDYHTVDVTAVIEYVWLDQMVQRRVTDRQKWIYDESTKRWRLAGGLPDFN